MRISGFSLLIFLVLSHPLFAAEKESSRPTKSGEIDIDSDPRQSSNVKRSIQVGLNAFKFDYIELIAPPKKSTESAVLPGFEARYTQDYGARSLFFDAIFKLTVGSTQYDGTTQPVNGSSQGVLPLSKTTAVTILDIGGDLGFTIPLSGLSTRLKPYLGGGFHLWNRGEADPATGDYREQYLWFIAVVGMKLQWSLSPRFGMELDASLRPAFAGVIRAYLSDASTSYPDVEMNLGASVGYRFELPMRYLLTPSFGLVASPWYEFSSIGQSNRVAIAQSDQTGTTYVQEPESRTIQYGGRLEAFFAF